MSVYASKPLNYLYIHSSNPGLPEFYIPFLNIIRDRLHDETVAICAHGHIGHAHDLPQPKSDDSLSLHAQIEAAAAVFRNLQREYPKTPFLLLGHSIGAHIALNVSTLKKFRHSKLETDRLYTQTASRYSMSVRLVLALQPTLSHLATTPNGRVLKASGYTLFQLLLLIIFAACLRQAMADYSCMDRSYPRQCISLSPTYSFQNMA